MVEFRPRKSGWAGIGAVTPETLLPATPGAPSLQRGKKREPGPVLHTVLTGTRTGPRRLEVAWVAA